MMAKGVAEEKEENEIVSTCGSKGERTPVKSKINHVRKHSEDCLINNDGIVEFPVENDAKPKAAKKPLNLDMFTIIKHLGTGKYGKVYLVK